MTLVQQLVFELSEYGIPCSKIQASTLVEYLNLVIEKNKTINLTRILNPQEAVTLHLVDSLLPLACRNICLDSSSTLMDMGTGAGFPGVPLAVMTDAQALLVDSVGKKTAAVQEFADTLNLSNICTCHSRLEDLAKRIPESQDVVIARAVARTNILIEYATPFLKMGSILVVEKGRPEDNELTEAMRASEICGLVLVSRETFELPRGLGHREIFIFKRESNSKIKLPRRVGVAKTDPIGVDK